MPTFLSPAVFTNEISLNALAANTSGIIPAFVGVCKKGPMNVPAIVTNAQNYLDTYGEPFPESYLGYAVMAFFEEGNICYVMRVGVESEEGQPEALSSVSIDTSGSKGQGWGRIPVFKGIDFGRISTRAAGDTGWSFHESSINFDGFTDAVLSSTNGPTNARLVFDGTAANTGLLYNGSVDDSFLLVITSAPTVSSGSAIDGAGYIIVRSSDGTQVATGNIVESVTPGLSDPITVADGIVVQVQMIGPNPNEKLDVNDSFNFSVIPNNRWFSISVDGNAWTFEMPVATYLTPDTMATAISHLTNGVGPEATAGITFSEAGFVAVADDEDDIVNFVTKLEGQMIQIVNTTHNSEGFALEIGQSLYAYDIPRSHLLGINVGPYTITTNSNNATIQVAGVNTTQQFTAIIPTGSDVPVSTIVAAINAAAVVLGTTLVVASTLTVPGGDEILLIQTTENNNFSVISMLVDGSHIKTLNFAGIVGIGYPYTTAYRGFNDERLILPQGGQITENSPLSCESNPTSSQCRLDQAYYANIVGWLVAPTPGTWADDYVVSLFAYKSANGVASAYELDVNSSGGVLLTRVQNISFDPTSSQYIGTLLNPVTGINGQSINGNEYVNWISRPLFLNNDPTDPSTFEVKLPAYFYNSKFAGQANGIPTDPIYTSELDSAVVGNPANSSGLYALSDPDAFSNVSLIIVPGFTSGSVITTELSISTNRGDCFNLVDPPFGLNAQQVVDWHNGLLFTDLRVALDSSYGALYHPWIQIADQYNGGTIWVPPSGHIAAIFARTDREAEMWFAPAGVNRGQIITALDTEVDLNRGDRDLEYGYGNAVNSIVNLPNKGIFVMGQRTLQRANTITDRVNVRMLLIAIKKALAGSQGLLNNYLFEPNDSGTRAVVTSTIDSYMSGVAARRGVTAWKTVCDNTNNTAARIDRNELWIALMIQPTPAIEFIMLNLGILSSDQSFTSEEILTALGITTTATA